jgi:hypothetical protein
VKSRFQSLPFKCNLQRYIEVCYGHALTFPGTASSYLAFEEAVAASVTTAADAVAAGAALTLSPNAGITVVGLCTLNSLDPYPMTYILSNP